LEGSEVQSAEFFYFVKENNILWWLKGTK
jgi:hypothetical protein